MKLLTLNIGLRTEDGILGAGYAASVIESVGTITALEVKHVTHGKGSEPTLVVEVEANKDYYKHVLIASRVLHQDCIAVWDNDVNLGTLIGDKADEWGAFDPIHFHFPSGK